MLLFCFSVCFKTLSLVDGGVGVCDVSISYGKLFEFFKKCMFSNTLTLRSTKQTVLKYIHRLHATRKYQSSSCRNTKLITIRASGCKLLIYLVNPVSWAPFALNTTWVDSKQDNYIMSLLQDLLVYIRYERISTKLLFLLYGIINTGCSKYFPFLCFYNEKFK